MFSIFNPAVQGRLLPQSSLFVSQGQSGKEIESNETNEKCLGRSFFKITKLTNSCIFYEWWQDTVVQWQSTWPLLTWDSVWYKDKEFLDFLTSFPDICLEWDWSLGCICDPIESYFFLPIYQSWTLRELIMNSNSFQNDPHFCKYF